MKNVIQLHIIVKEKEDGTLNCTWGYQTENQLLTPEALGSALAALETVKTDYVLADFNKMRTFSYDNQGQEDEAEDIEN